MDAGDFARKLTRSLQLFSPSLAATPLLQVGAVGWGWLAISGLGPHHQHWDVLERDAPVLVPNRVFWGSGGGSKWGHFGGQKRVKKPQKNDRFCAGVTFLRQTIY